MADTTELIIDKPYSDSSTSLKDAYIKYYNEHSDESPAIIQQKEERVDEIAAEVFFFIVFIIAVVVISNIFKLHKVGIFKNIFGPIHNYFGKLLKFLESKLPDLTEEEYAYYNNAHYNEPTTKPYYIYDGYELNFSKKTLQEALEKRFHFIIILTQYYKKNLLKDCKHLFNKKSL